MKKVFSVFLAALMMICCMAPVYAEGTSHSVTFRAPDTGYTYPVNNTTPGATESLDADAFSFVVSKDGKMSSFHEIEGWDFAEEPDRGYVYYEPEDAYYYYQDILFDEDKAKFGAGTKRYEPDIYPTETPVTVEDGEQISFIVTTNEKYDAASIVVFANDQLLERKSNGEYVVTVDRDLTIDVQEKNADGAPVLMRNHYTISLVSGDGYSVKTRKEENNRYAYYGDTFKFRVKIASGFSGTDMKVKAISGGNDLSEFLGEDADMLTNLLDKSDPLPCLGQDEDGCYLYETKGITADTRIVVSGVKEASKSGILAKLKRILRLILDFFGIHFDFLDDGNGSGLLAYHTVTITDNTYGIPGFSYEITASATDDPHAGTIKVMNGEGIGIKLTYTSSAPLDRVYTSEEDTVGTYPVGASVTWTIEGKPAVTNYKTNWIAHFNRYTGEYVYTADYYIDSITADAAITINYN